MNLLDPAGSTITAIPGSNLNAIQHGEEIFRFLLAEIQPAVLVVHGAGPRKKLASLLNFDLGGEPKAPDDLRIHGIDGILVAVIPSLAPPAYNKWSSWSADHLSRLAKVIANQITTGDKSPC